MSLDYSKFIVDEAFKCINQNIPLMTLFRKKPKFEESITLALFLSSLDPSMREKIGIFWIDDNTIALKTNNLAHSIGLKPNSINCSLRQHQLKKIGKVSNEDIKYFENKHNWKIISDEGGQFTRSKVEGGNDKHLLRWIKPEKQTDKHTDKQIDTQNEENEKQIEQQEQFQFGIELLSFDPENILSHEIENDFSQIMKNDEDDSNNFDMMDDLYDFSYFDDE